MWSCDDISEGEQEEDRLQALIDSSPLALVEFGLDTRIRLWNPAAERIFGWSREEMLGRGGLPMAPPSKRAESEELFARVRAGESVNDYETVRQRNDGMLVAVSIAAAPVRNGSGRVVGNMVAYTDITERKLQEAEVHRLNAELHARLEELAASRPSRTPATSLPLRSSSCASSPAASIRRCSAITACELPSRCSRADRPSRSRSPTSPTSGCRSPLKRLRTT